MSKQIVLSVFGFRTWEVGYSGEQGYSCNRCGDTFLLSNFPWDKSDSYFKHKGDLMELRTWVREHVTRHDDHAA